MKHTPDKNKRERQRGSVLATSTFSMLALLLSAGLAVDISHFYTVKAELQNAADASALAAASQLNSTKGGIKLAVAEATKALNQYDFKKSVTITSADITFADNLNGTYVSQATAETNATQMRFVKVTLPPSQVKVFFAAIALGQNKSLTATATAGVSVGLSMNKFNAALAFIEPDATPLAKDQVHTLSAKSWNSNTPNSYRVLEGGSGDLIVTGNIHSYDYPVATYRAQKLVDTEACRLAKIGFNARFGDYSTHPQVNATVAPPDTVTTENITYDQYRLKQATGPLDYPTGMKNRRIITLPITTKSDYDTATRDLDSNRLGAFFIKRKVNSDCAIEVEYIGETLALPVGEFRPGDTQVNEFAIPVLYK